MCFDAEIGVFTGCSGWPFMLKRGSSGYDWVLTWGLSCVVLVLKPGLKQACSGSEMRDEMGGVGDEKGRFGY